jgi:hypothetical protein
MTMSESSLVIFDAVLPERFRAVPGAPGKAETESSESRLMEIDASACTPSESRAFGFRLVLEQSKIDEAESDALYARCKDGTLMTTTGVTYVDFDRHADSLEEAIRSAIADVQAAGFHAVRVEIDTDNLMLQHA